MSSTPSGARSAHQSRCTVRMLSPRARDTVGDGTPRHVATLDARTVPTPQDDAVLPGDSTRAALDVIEPPRLQAHIAAVATKRDTGECDPAAGACDGVAQQDAAAQAAAQLAAAQQTATTLLQSASAPLFVSNKSADLHCKVAPAGEMPSRSPMPDAGTRPALQQIALNQPQNERLESTDVGVKAVAQPCRSNE